MEFLDRHPKRKICKFPFKPCVLCKAELSFCEKCLRPFKFPLAFHCSAFSFRDHGEPPEWSDAAVVQGFSVSDAATEALVEPTECGDAESATVSGDAESATVSGDVEAAATETVDAEATEAATVSGAGKKKTTASTKKKRKVEEDRGGSVTRSFRGTASFPWSNGGGGGGVPCSTGRRSWTVTPGDKSVSSH